MSTDISKAFNETPVVSGMWRSAVTEIHPVHTAYQRQIEVTALFRALSLTLAIRSIIVGSGLVF